MKTNNKQKLPKIDYSKNLELLRYDLSGIQDIEKYTVRNNTYTAVQKLREKLVKILTTTIDYETQIALSNAFTEAEKDEKEQMKIAFQIYRDLLSHYEDGSAFEDYYNKTYGGGEQ
jgi:hypothetical protein